MDSAERALARVEGATLTAGWLGIGFALWAGMAWLIASAVGGIKTDGASGLRGALTTALVASFVLALLVAPLHRGAGHALHLWRTGDPVAAARARRFAAWGIPVSVLGSIAATGWAMTLAWRPIDLARNDYEVDYFVEGAFTIPGAGVSFVVAVLMLALLPPLVRLAAVRSAPVAPRPHQTSAPAPAHEANALAMACRATLVSVQIALPFLLVAPLVSYSSQTSANDHGMGAALLGLASMVGLGLMFAYSALVTLLLKAATRVAASAHASAAGQAIAFLWVPALTGSAAVATYMAGSSGGAVLELLAANRGALLGPAIALLCASMLVAASALILLVLLGRLMLPTRNRSTRPRMEVAHS